MKLNQNLLPELLFKLILIAGIAEQAPNHIFIFFILAMIDQSIVFGPEQSELSLEGFLTIV